MTRTRKQGHINTGRDKGEVREKVIKEQNTNTPKQESEVK